jgi:hypothetical protein
MPGGYVVRDANGQALAYVYSRATETDAIQRKQDLGIVSVRNGDDPGLDPRLSKVWALVSRGVAQQSSHGGYDGIPAGIPVR